MREGASPATGPQRLLVELEGHPFLEILAQLSLGVGPPLGGHPGARGSPGRQGRELRGPVPGRADPRARLQVLPGRWRLAWCADLTPRTAGRPLSLLAARRPASAARAPRHRVAGRQPPERGRRRPPPQQTSAEGWSVVRS